MNFGNTKLQKALEKRSEPNWKDYIKFCIYFVAQRTVSENRIKFELY
jgi:hypothetical protein